MINKIKKIANTKDKKRLLSNFFSLSILQGANYILHLITLPYLVRVLGIENYGILTLATSVIMYFGILVDYGFNTTATRSISINRNNFGKVQEIYSAIMSIKFFLLMIALIILIFLTSQFDYFKEYQLIYLLTFGILVGQFLFPTWLFQGLEEMKYITYIYLTFKLIFTLALFIFVTNKDDFYLVPLLNGIGFILAGVYSILLTRHKFQIKFSLPKSNIIKLHLSEGWNIFVASLAGNIYGQGNIILLGIFTSPLIVGYYSIAQKLTVSVVGIFQVFSQTLMPYFSNLSVLDKENFTNKIKKTLQYSIMINIVLIGTLLLISDFIYTLISGKNNEIGFYAFSFWLIISFFTILNVVLHPILISLKQDKYMARFYLFVSISFLIYASIFTFLYTYKGMLLSMLIVEVLILIFSIYGVIIGIKNNEKNSNNF